MKKMEAEMNFSTDELQLFNGKTRVPMTLNVACQYIVPVSNFKPIEHSVCAAGHQPDAPPMPTAETVPEDQFSRDAVPPHVSKRGSSPLPY